MESFREVNEVSLSDFVNRILNDVDNLPDVESAAQLLVKNFYESLRSNSESATVLCRIFHSFEYQALPAGLQQRAAQTVGEVPAEDHIFLSLLGSYGDEVSWRHRTGSQGHQTIPITRESIKKIPMMTRLFQQIGFDLGLLLGEGSPGIDVSGVARSYSIFYVKDAKGSPYIPAQEFVEKYGIRSVIGTGVMLPTNDVSIFIAFCRDVLDEMTASSIVPLMSLFWQKVFPLVDRGFFAESKGH